MLDGDLGAFASETMEKLLVVPEAATTLQLSSVIAENGLSVIVVMPVGSAVPGGGCTTAVTVIVELPVLPSLVAVTCTLPITSAVTRPDAETPAMLGVAELQVTTRPVSTLLLASRVTAESCTVEPI
jgi:hypothetical protein